MASGRQPRPPDAVHDLDQDLSEGGRQDVFQGVTDRVTAAAGQPQDDRWTAQSADRGAGRSFLVLWGTQQPRSPFRSHPSALVPALAIGWLTSLSRPKDGSATGMSLTHPDRTEASRTEASGTAVAVPVLMEAAEKSPRWAATCSLPRRPILAVLQAKRDSGHRGRQPSPPCACGEDAGGEEIAKRCGKVLERNPGVLSIPRDSSPGPPSTPPDPSHHNLLKRPPRPPHCCSRILLPNLTHPTV